MDASTYWAARRPRPSDLRPMIAIGFCRRIIFSHGMAPLPLLGQIRTQEPFWAG
jgi:hypothetical protein